MWICVFVDGREGGVRFLRYPSIASGLGTQPLKGGSTVNIV
jgi:hypothetical protein